MVDGLDKKALGPARAAVAQRGGAEMTVFMVLFVLLLIALGSLTLGVLAVGLLVGAAQCLVWTSRRCFSGLSIPHGRRIHEARTAYPMGPKPA